VTNEELKNLITWAIEVAENESQIDTEVAKTITAKFESGYIFVGEWCRDLEIAPSGVKVLVRFKSGDFGWSCKVRGEWVADVPAQLPTCWAHWPEPPK